MSDSVQSDLFFSTPQPSAAAVPCMITALDADLLKAWVQINGAKLGVWHAAPPFDENDSYQPFREGASLKDWMLGYNQGELLELSGYSNSAVFAPNAMIVDAKCNEAPLLEAEAKAGEGGYENYADFPTLLAKINWALISVGPDRNYAMVVTSPAKAEYLELLRHWCHQHGRTYFNLLPADGAIDIHPFAAPEQFQRGAVHEQAAQMLTKLAHFGVPAKEVQTALNEMMERIQ